MHSQDLAFGPDYFSFLDLFTSILVATGILETFWDVVFCSTGISWDFWSGIYSSYLDIEIY